MRGKHSGDGGTTAGHYSLDTAAPEALHTALRECHKYFKCTQKVKVYTEEKTVEIEGPQYIH